MPREPTSKIQLMPPTYLNVVLRNLTPESVQDVLAGTGLHVSGTDGVQHAIALEQMRAAIANLRQAMGADWHLQLIHRLNLFAHGSLGVAAATAPDLQGAINVLERYTVVRAPFLKLETTLEADDCVICLQDRANLGEAGRDMLETAMLGIQSLLEQVRGSPLERSQMRFALPPPPYRDALEDLIQGQAVFDAAHFAIAFPRSWLGQTSPMHDPAMHRAALLRVEAEFEALASEASVSSMVRRALLAGSEQPPSLVEIARGQHVAPRTLIRRLKREGTSYQQIFQQVRAQRAEELLADPALTVKQVSYVLGYKDPSNFGRAFRHWQGQSPGSYRRNVLGQGRGTGEK